MTGWKSVGYIIIIVIDGMRTLLAQIKEYQKVRDVQNSNHFKIEEAESEYKKGGDEVKVCWTREIARYGIVIEVVQNTKYRGSAEKMVRTCTSELCFGVVPHGLGLLCYVKSGRDPRTEAVIADKTSLSGKMH